MTTRDNRVRISDEEREKLDELKQEVPRLNGVPYGEAIGEAADELLEAESGDDSGANF